MISTLVIVGLALVWAVVLLPDLMSRISRSRRSDTIGSFNSQLSSLSRSSPVKRDDNVIELGERRVARLRSVRKGASRLPGVPSPYIGSTQPAATADRTTRPGHPREEPVRTARPTSGAGHRAASHAVRKRRQDVLITLGAAALLTLLATVAFGGVFLYLHLAADVLMLAYLVALQRVVTRPDQQAVPAGSRPAHLAVSAIGSAAAPAGASLVDESLEVHQIAN